MVTPILGFSDPRRRSSKITDLPSLQAELQRLYDARRTDQLDDAKARTLRQVLRDFQDLLLGAQYEARLGQLEGLLAQPRSLEAVSPEPLALEAPRDESQRKTKGRPRKA